nr:cytochrome c-type biogenesis CcmF C-terminal domain-containing protein [Paracoccus tegillarcae]
MGRLDGHSAIAVIGAGLGVWLVLGAASELIHRTGRSGLSRLVRLPRADWGKAVAHSGLGITFIGVALLTAWQVEDIRVAQIDEAYDVGGYSLTLRSVDEVQGPNYLSTMAAIDVSKDGEPVATLHPEKRIYPVQAMPTTRRRSTMAFSATSIW